MNKTYTIILILVLLIVLGGVGYAIWAGQNSGVKAPVTTSTDTSNTNTNTAPVAEAGLPTVETNSTSAPYISTVVVNGIVNPNGAATTYWFDYGETTALGAQTSGYLLGAGYATFYAPAYITGLKANTNYYFRLSAKNSIGTVSGATYSFKTSTVPAPTGTAPTADATPASNIAGTTANLNGRINPKNSVTTFWFEYGLTSNMGTVTSFQTSNTNNSSSEVSASVSNLQPSTKYYFRLDAQNQFGTVNGQILNFTTTQGPSAAVTPTVKTNSATSVTNNSAKLNAIVNSGGAITTYWFEYGNDALLSNPVVTSTTKQTLDVGTSAVNVSADISNLNNNTQYYFRSVAQNQYGTVSGDISSFTTKK